MAARVELVWVLDDAILTIALCASFVIEGFFRTISLLVISRVRFPVMSNPFRIS